MTHAHLIGQTGTGKTSAILNRIDQNISSDTGFCFIDPHGDAARDALFLIPPEKADRLIYIDASEGERPVGFNVLYGVDPDTKTRDTVTENLVSTFIHLFGKEDIGRRSEMVLRNSIRMLFDVPRSTLLDIPRLITDTHFRHRYYPAITKSTVETFWTTLEAEDMRYQEQVVGPILNKLDKLLFHDAIRKIVGQDTSTIDFRRAMDTGQFIIVNLAKGQIGESPAHMLGALIVSTIMHAAFSRHDTSEEERRPFDLIIDEFQNFITGSITTILSEARKYALSLVLSHQFLSQVPKEVQGAVLGNISHTLAFRLGAEDAEIISKHIDRPAQNLLDLDNYTAWEWQLHDGRVGNARYRGKNHNPLPPPPEPKVGDARAMLETSRRKYGRRISP